MTEEWKKIIIRYHHIVVCILMGLLVLGGVFVGSIQTDLNTTEKHFSDTISYIKEQCTGYDNLNLASETKSLMRVMENVQHLCSDIERERELDDSFVQSHRSFFVNLSHVVRITKTECSLDNGETIPVSRGAYKKLNEEFIRFYREAIL